MEDLPFGKPGGNRHETAAGLSHEEPPVEPEAAPVPAETTPAEQLVAAHGITLERPEDAQPLASLLAKLTAETILGESEAELAARYGISVPELLAPLSLRERIELIERQLVAMLGTIESGTGLSIRRISPAELRQPLE